MYHIVIQYHHMAQDIQQTLQNVLAKNIKIEDPILLHVKIDFKYSVLISNQYNLQIYVILYSVYDLHKHLGDKLI